MAPKRQRSPTPPKDAITEAERDFWVSEKVEDRSSIFQAFFSPNIPARDLQNLDQIESASHRILAWRSPSSQRTLVANVRTLETGTDDDGERYGGRHVLKVLDEMRVEGALVVARWYGGVMLGPARFAHIENCARDAIRAWRQNEDSEGQKRRRVEDEAMERASLIVELVDRDQNIKVLRGLLEEKTKKTQPRTEKSADPPPRPVARDIDYSSMPLERLRQFDKARDSTVAFLLKKIDEAEKQNDVQEVTTKSEGDRKEKVEKKDETSNVAASTNDDDEGHVPADTIDRTSTSNDSKVTKQDTQESQKASAQPSPA